MLEGVDKMNSTEFFGPFEHNPKIERYNYLFQLLNRMTFIKKKVHKNKQVEVEV